MSRFVLKKLFWLFLGLLYTTSCSHLPRSNQTPKNNFSSTYKITNGISLEGKEYVGTASLEESENTLTMNWKTTIGDYSGFGVQKGGNIWIAWGNDPIFGIAVFKLEDNQLKGVWTINNSQVIGSEVAKGGSMDDFAGYYAVSGRTPEKDSHYFGSLEIIPTEETYQVRWQVQGQSYTGIGIRSGKYLGIAWGPQRAFGIAVYNPDSKGNLTGKWTVPGAIKTTTEDLTLPVPTSH